MMSRLYHSALVLLLTSLTGLVSSLIEEEKKATFLTANVGDSVAFNCPLDFPQDIAIPYVLQWNKESKTVFSRYDGGALTAEEPYEHRVGLLTDNSQFGKGSINLTSVRESDAGWYECRVSFPYRTPSSRPNGTWFHLTVEGGDLLAIPPMNQTTLEGESAHFPCVTKDREAVVEWYKDGVSITQLNELSERSWIGPEGSLTISPTIMSDLGQFQCQVMNKEGEKQTASAFLDVQYKAKVVYAPQDVFLPYGRPGILDCHFRANPPLTKLRWEKDGFLFDPFNVQGVFNRRNGSLFFSKVDESHGGEYTCTPFNELGSEGPSSPINVIVQRPPVFTATPHNLYLRKPGENIEIPCDAIDGHSTHRPTIIWFKKDGNPLPESRSSVSGGNLTITNIGESDRGLYQCVASNEAATISAETEIMIENSLPRAPYNLTAESTFNTITIHWRPAYGRPYMEYSIWYRATDTPEWRTMRVMTRGAMQASISSLSPGREYEIMVLSQDHMGDGMFSKALRVRTKGSAGTFDGSTQDIKNPLGTFQQIGPPINVQIEVTMDGYHVNWNQPEFGVDLLKYYTVRWYKGPSEHYTDKADTTETSYTVHNLEEESTYHFQVQATTTNGYQSTSETFILHVPAYRKTRAFSIGIAIGIGFLIAAAVAAFYIRNVNRRTSHKQRDLVA